MQQSTASTISIHQNGDTPLTTIKCIAPTGDICGEAVIFSAEENSLYWTDINRFLVHKMDLSSTAVRSYMFDEPVVALSLTDRSDQLLVSLGSKLIFLEPETDQREDLSVVLPDSPKVRFNEGRTDPLGNFWVGSMGNNVGPEGESLDTPLGIGKLFRYRYGGELEEFEANIDISNTLCWAPDGKTFYFGDTLKNTLRAYPFNPESGDIGPGAPHFAGFDRGLPDGSAIDAEGYIWNCRYSGSCIVRVAPNGTVDRVIDMPVKNITTCCFGGPNLSTLYITTASAGKGQRDRLAGSLFAIETDTQGLSENHFRTKK